VQAVGKASNNVQIYKPQVKITPTMRHELRSCPAPTFRRIHRPKMTDMLPGFCVSLGAVSEAFLPSIWKQSNGGRALTLTTAIPHTNQHSVLMISLFLARLCSPRSDHRFLQIDTKYQTVDIFMKPLNEGGSTNTIHDNSYSTLFFPV